MDQRIQIIEMDPEKAPRTSAIILVLCGLLGVGFFVVNVAFTGEDPYQKYTRPYDGDETHVWQGDDKFPIQEGYHIMPNLWRGRSTSADDAPEDELEDGVLQKMEAAANKAGQGKPTTNPAAPGTATPSTAAPTTPGAPPGPNPFTITKPGETTPGK